MSKATEKRCSFCNSPASKVIGKLIEAEGVAICSSCVATCADLVKQSNVPTKRSSPKSISKTPRPTEIKAHLDQYIIGQEHAKIALSVAVCDHYKRINAAPEQLDDIVLEKSNVLLIGPTGTGKTHLARAIAAYLNVPFAIGDATSLTEAGYVGDDIESLLTRLYQAAEGDIEAAQKGILFIDEIDKLKKTGGNVSISRDVAGEGVQQGLLKLLEGSVCSIPVGGARKHPQEKVVQFDTTNVLFVCGGAFVGLNDIVKERLGVKQEGLVGFAVSDKDTSESYDDDNILRHLETEDLIEFGLIPEFIGRLPIQTALTPLSKEALRRILIEPKNSLLGQFKLQFRLDKVELIITEGAIDQIVDEAYALNTGARGLRAVVEKMVLDYKYHIADYIESGKCVIDGKFIKADFKHVDESEESDISSKPS
jgi:ATP-dependent Clp protease ATP-binding subunit ClpX